MTLDLTREPLYQISKGKATAKAWEHLSVILKNISEIRKINPLDLGGTNGL